MQIVSTLGVPYDATKASCKEFNIVAKKPGEKGVNHRFKTLGHDPVLGIMIGTANIMTNTITVVPDGFVIPRTVHVRYDSSFRNPVMDKNARFDVMINKVTERAKTEPRALVAALIKQIIHLGTDVYTKAGIPLPMTGLVLEPQFVEIITKYLSQGDIIKKVGVTGAEDIINKALYIIHGLMLFAEGGDALLADELSRIRTEKIISYSMAIAEGSNILKQIATQNYLGVDIKHIAGVYKRIYTDMDLIDDLKYEFIHSGLDSLYADEIAH